jgi:hypothetical protein
MYPTFPGIPLPEAAVLPSYDEVSYDMEDMKASEVRVKPPVTPNQTTVASLRTASPRRAVSKQLLGVTTVSRALSASIRSQSTPRTPATPAHQLIVATPKSRDVVTPETPKSPGDARKPPPKRVQLACPYIGLMYANMRGDRVANSDLPDMGGFT